MAQQKKYKAFISYSHSDSLWGEWLHKTLERYRTPKRLIGRETPNGPVPGRLLPIFRDRDELASSPDLSSTIRDALEQSENLIVICSPAAAKSKWVNREIEVFKQLGSSHRIFCLIVEGDPANLNTKDDCFPPMLRQEVDSEGNITTAVIEPIAADTREHADGKQLARLKIIAGLLGVGLDELRQREQQRRTRRLLTITVSSLAASAITIALAINATIARNEAEQRQQQAEELLSFMVGDLRDSLQTIGRLDILESVADQAQQYFSLVDVDQLSEGELSRQAEALTQLGEIRLDQLQYDEAISAFHDAYERSATLASNAPEDGDRLFNRSQAEFWIGFVAFRSSDLNEARAWMARYRNSTIELIQLNPSNREWLREVAFGYHNLAVIDYEVGDLEKAIAGFEDEIEIFNQLLAEGESNRYRRDRADAHSWMGNVNLELGNIEAASNNFESAEFEIREVFEQDSDNAVWLQDLAFATELVAYHKGIMGELETASDKIRESNALFSQLIELDASNTDSKRGQNKALISQAYIETAKGNLSVAWELTQFAIDSLNSMVEQGAIDHNVRHELALSHSLASWVSNHEGDSSSALSAAKTTTKLLEEIEKSTNLNNERLGILAFSYLLQAQAYESAGNLQLAQKSIEEGVNRIGGVANNSNSPFLLDPLARLLSTINTNRAQEIRERLISQGYAPLIPW